MGSHLFEDGAVFQALETSLETAERPEAALQAALDQLASWAGCDRCALIVVDKAQRSVRRFVRGGVGWSDVMTTIGFDELLAGLTGWAIETGEVAVSPRDGDDPRESPEVRFRRHQTKCGSILVAPLGPASDRWGTLTLINRPDQPDFGQAEADALKRIAPAFAQAVRLADAHEEAVRARAEAHAAVKSKLSFLSNLSHELRTPLNGILGFSNLLAASSLEPSQEAMVNTILVSGQRLLDTVDNILELAQFEAGQFRLDVQPFSPRTVFASLVGRYEKAAQEKGLAWTASVDLEVPTVVEGDAVRLSQAWGHLLSNAVKFTASGSIKVGLEARARGQGRWDLVFLAEDTGIGLAADRSGQWFSPFHQEDGSLTRKFGGTGLGLALCDRIVRSMGGTLSLQGVPGVGTKVRASVNLGGEGSTVYRSSPSLRLLLQHDNSAEGLHLVSLLERLGHRVDVVSGLTQAAEGVTHASYEAVLVAVGAAGAAFEALKRESAQRGLHLIVLGPPDNSPWWTASIPMPPSVGDLEEALEKCHFRRVP